MDYFEQICNTFLKNFAESVKLNDQLPVNVSSTQNFTTGYSIGVNFACFGINTYFCQ